MLMYADGKLIPVNYIFNRKGSMKWHDWGILSDRTTGKELGITMCSVTSSDRYRGRFSINKKDFQYASLPDKVLYYYFQDNIAPKRELVVTVQRLIEVIDTLSLNDSFKDYMIVTWEELTGEEFDYSNMPF